jgi:hypothetical protein
MEKTKRWSVRWLLMIAVSGTFLGGAVAYARQAECWECRPCGCSPDGGAILCCDVKGC